MSILTALHEHLPASSHWKMVKGYFPYPCCEGIEGE
jgi:hypothetical protein